MPQPQGKILDRARQMRAGDAVSFPPDGIHSVSNETGEVTASLHVWGKHWNDTGRARFDPDAKSEASCIVKQGSQGV